MTPLRPSTLLWRSLKINPVWYLVGFPFCFYHSFNLRSDENLYFLEFYPSSSVNDNNPRIKKPDWILTAQKILGMHVCHDSTFQHMLDASDPNHTLLTSNFMLPKGLKNHTKFKTIFLNTLHHCGSKLVHNPHKLLRWTSW